MIDLKSVVEKYPECLDSATKFKSYMMDLYPDNSNKARIRILADIVDCGIALEIKNGKTDSISISNFCNTMENQYGYSTKLVEECINQFLVAFTLVGTSPQNVKMTNDIKVFSKSKACDYDVVYDSNLHNFEIEDVKNKINHKILIKYRGKSSAVAIPDGVTIISDVFRRRSTLTRVYIPSSVVRIVGSTFVGCSNLTEITIPDSVLDIGESAFKDTAYYDNFENWNDNVLYICNHLIEAKKSISGQYIIKPGTKTIANSAFKRCENIENIFVPNGVVSIGYEAFKFCTKLTHISFPDSIEYVNGSILNHTAFYKNPTNWENKALYVDRHLIDVKKSIDGQYIIKPGTKTICAGAFYGCTNLSNVILPDSIKVINSCTFRDCKSLTDIVIPNGVTDILGSAFGWCYNLVKVTISKSVINIEASAFEGCHALKTVCFYSEEQKNKFTNRFEPHVELIVKSK